MKEFARALQDDLNARPPQPADPPPPTNPEDADLLRKLQRATRKHPIIVATERAQAQRDQTPPTPSSPPLALNDDDGLTAALSRALGAPVNTTTNL